MKHAWKVGAMVLLFGGLLFGAYATLGKTLFTEPTQTYRAVFSDAGGAVSGSSVLLSGVNVGQIQEVKLERAGRAVLVLSIKKGVEIPTGTTAALTASLVGFGDRPLELIPPTPASTSVLPEDSEIPGRIKSSLEGVVPDTTETIAELNKTLQATQKLISDQELRNKVVALLDSSNETMTTFGKLAARIDNVTAENQATVRKTLLQASAMLSDVSKATSAVARIASEGKMEKKMVALLDDMSASVKEGQGLITDLRKTVNDEELQGPVKEILANTKTMSESGTRIAANAETMSANGIELSNKAIEIATKASKLADELSELIQKFDSALGKFGGIASSGAGAGIGRLETEASMVRETDPGRTRAEISATLPIGKEYFTIGMWDAFESNKLIAQSGRDLNKNTRLRYGVYASQLGIGVQSRIAPGVWLRGDLFDVNEPRLDLRSSFELGNDIHLLLGIDKVFSRNAPTIGVGIRR